MKPEQQQLLSILVFGARGYSGLELLKLLSTHPFVKSQNLKIIAVTTDQSSSESLQEIPLIAQNNIVILKISEVLQNSILNSAQFAFLATPAEASLELTQKLIEFAHIKIIDLSGAFRLPAEPAEKIYGIKQTFSDSTVYGLQPFAKSLVHSNTRIISNPGCYATAIQMALIPLVKNKLISLSNIVIDAKSGTTGAGKKLSETSLFSEVSENCTPYRIGKHQHLPEIEMGIEKFGSNKADIQLVTHLLPVTRGISAGIYTSTHASEREIENAYNEFYADYPLVRHGKNKNYLKLSETNFTGFTSIYYEIHQNRLYLFSIIDNLQKGAASQAIENFNLLNQLPIYTGVLK